MTKNPVMKDMNNEIYLNQLLSKLNRRKVGTLWLDSLTRYHYIQIPQEGALILLDLLVAVITRDSCICEDDQSLEYLRDNFDTVQNFWTATISRFSRRFSTQHSVDGVDWVRMKLLVSVLIKDKEHVERFLRSLYTEISLAEYRGVPFEDQKTEVPSSLLSTYERRTFFKPLVPLDTKWKK